MSVALQPIAQSLPALLGSQPFSQLGVLVDEHTARHCYPLVKPHLPRHTLIRIRSGEAHKTLATCTCIWRAMTAARFDRHALLLNLGGGVIGDMGGFCAATYKRGMAFAQLPTTLLAQVDASVGGKLGVDFEGLKNHLGAFQQPAAVLIDPAFLRTLPPAQLRSGFAEVIKHCLIADADQWQQLRHRELDQQDWPALIAHSVAIKERIVQQDPTEQGLRKVLNFGHTLGHAVESFYLAQPRKKLLHGEAIAVGMVAESYLSYRRDRLALAELGQVEEFVFATFGRVPVAEADFAAIVSLTRQDKKNRAGRVKAALLNGIGQAGFDVDLTPREMRAALAYYRGN